MLIDKSLILPRFDYLHGIISASHSSVVLVSVHVVRRMSSAWLQRDRHVIIT